MQIVEEEFGYTSVVFTPEPQFTGWTELTYIASDGRHESNVGTVSILVYPEIQFGAAQVGEPGDLTVYAEASTVTGASLPDGTYSWTFDGVEESGPVSTHGKRYYTFARAGVHTVTLSVLLFGMAGEISCTTDTSSDKQLQISLNDAQPIHLPSSEDTPAPVDCNRNGIADLQEIADNPDRDCNGNGVPDDCDISAGTAIDDNGNGIIDSCESDPNSLPMQPRDEQTSEVDTPDCNGNGVADDADIELGTSQDCNGNGTPDECDIQSGDSSDVNGNRIPDECELDCNGNSVPDAYEIAEGMTPDCNGNGVPDDCDIAAGTSQDCNANGIPDGCDIASGTSTDLNGDGQPDECQLDCNGNNMPDAWEIAQGMAQDCNGNGVPDECEIGAGTSQDCNENGVPDECDLAAGTSQDCNENGIPDECDITSGTSADLNGDGQPDECQLDCNGNNMPDAWEIAQGMAQDCNGNGVPDDCDLADGTSSDADGDGVPDDCQTDCNANQVPDSMEISQGTAEDCNGNGVPDECDLAAGTSSDCNGNGIPDECDIANGTSTDADGDGLLDECEDIFYVDDDGASQPGYDSGQPLGSYNNPFDTIQSAVNAAGAGDTIVIFAGTYAELVSVDIHATEAAGLTIRSESGNPGAVIVTGAEDGGGQRRACFELVDAEYVTLQGLTCEFAESYIIKVANSTHIDIERCVTRNGGGHGILMGGSGGTTFSTIRDCESHDNGFSGIFLGGSDDFAQDVLVERCVSYRNGWAHLAWAQGIVASWKTNSTAGHTERITIRKCVAYDNGMNIGMQDCKDSTISECIVWGNLPGTDGNGYKIGLHGYGSGNKLEKSVAFAADMMGIRISNSPGVQVVNNTIFDCGGAGSGCGIQMDEGTYLNNCVFDNHHEIDGLFSYDWRSTHTFDSSNHNLWKDSDGVLRDMPPNEGAASIYGDPGLNKSAALTAADEFEQRTITLDQLFEQVEQALTPSGAPLVDAGVDVGLPFEGAAPDIGAFESSAD